MLKPPNYVLCSENKCPNCGADRWGLYHFNYAEEEFVPNAYSNEIASAIKDGELLTIIDNSNWGNYIMDVCAECGIALTHPGS